MVRSYLSPTPVGVGVGTRLDQALSLPARVSAGYARQRSARGDGALHNKQLLGGVWRTAYTAGFPLAETSAEYTAKPSTSLNEAYEGKRRKCSLESHGSIARTKGKEIRQGHSIVIINPCAWPAECK